MYTLVSLALIILWPYYDSLLFQSTGVPPGLPWLLGHQSCFSPSWGWGWGTSAGLGERLQALATVAAVCFVPS